MSKVLAAATAALLVFTVAPALAKPNKAALEKSYLDLNEQCRGGSGDDPDTIKACDQREEVSAQLRQLHVCFAGDRFQRCK
ncbi:hypothetical protein [Mesorhizobium sp. M7A.F.Ca.MR.245.00.0.0]|uniref:hypothetical protein n=1 Tax=Mesorhizobium sp. M7A.F.Ca.MR.245.00.0.0 TaxID=2496778 RepID=UPI000FCA9BE0|nr:hypothetical protein [Mesorhizobium sp. M7A.F.Ca.MR.245.00.0.0]RUV19965.1 hypothetical protein EOB80_17270 [Mesorhizobium sp. M7A.F.Ca.MR.245.00.0.0]RUV53782.1 hypothetical protein EOB77_00575 [Mesorhizobium sp. M7A.F.Ca.MR.228.00.0.0]